MRDETAVPFSLQHQQYRSLAFDPMSTLLEKWVRPRLAEMRRAASRAWMITLNNWVIEEETLIGYDTERLERLVDQAWVVCREEIGIWDSRFTLQSLRSLPPAVIELVTQTDDAAVVAAVIRVATAAAATANGSRWPRGENEQRNWIELDPEQLAIIAAQAPSVLGGCLGAACLVYYAQGWYRWAGKGKRLQRMPARLSPEDLAVIDKWDGTGMLLLTAPVLSDEPVIEKAVAIYEARRDAVVNGGRQSGLLGSLEKSVRAVGSTPRMWYVGWRGTQASLPVNVPGLKLTFPAPAWYPLADFHLKQWIEQLRPFDDMLRVRLHLSCDELLAALTALGLVIERQTQCGYLRAGKWAGADALLLESPAEGPFLLSAVSHLASVLLRGTLRVSVDAFITALSAELDEVLGWPQARQLAETFLDAFKGSLDRHGLPSPILFYVLDPLTCVLDLSLWHGFADACLAIATSGDGNIGSRRGHLFEAQVREYLIEALQLAESDIPWPANRDVWSGGTNLGDVDFCFVRGGVLFHLDMKSWQHTSDYFVGHYHTVLNRMNILKKQIKRVEMRGDALQHQLEKTGLSFADRLDFLVVAFPEYLTFDERSFWYGEQPRVVTAAELGLLAAREPAVLRGLRLSRLTS